jgi:hypothetical protein
MKVRENNHISWRIEPVIVERRDAFARFPRLGTTQFPRLKTT